MPSPPCVSYMCLLKLEMEASPVNTAGQVVIVSTAHAFIALYPDDLKQ